MKKEKEKEIITKPASNKRFAAMDAARKEKVLESKYPRFFGNSKVEKHRDKVIKIVQNYFGSSCKMYVNKREHKYKNIPFYSVKVESPYYPNNLTEEQKENYYYGPLKKMGVEVVYATGTDSYIHRIYK